MRSNVAAFFSANYVRNALRSNHEPEHSRPGISELTASRLARNAAAPERNTGTVALGIVISPSAPVLRQRCQLCLRTCRGLRPRSHV